MTFLGREAEPWLRCDPVGALVLCFAGGAWTEEVALVNWGCCMRREQILHDLQECRKGQARLGWTLTHRHPRA